ncbi:growth-regulating factor 3-like [Typha latifolia]|uniref:growth-regulating factor 3-like n=1 Tax=Typha latifolia TaxID=4733 RepID=UPI003C2C653E
MAKPYASYSPAGDQTVLFSPLFCRALGGEKGGEMNAAAAAAGVTWRAPFTAAQWEELEQQALIYKYLVAGVPVPPDLLLSIRRSFESMAARFYHHPSLGYCSYFGKKLDPEPGRCRRTDGKKWRCSKEAYPDSKYCERHMHRGRNRSRKPVETQTVSQSQSPSASTVTSLPLSGSSGSGSFQSHPLHSVAGSSSIANSFAATGPSASQLQIETGAYGAGTKDFRYSYGVRAATGEHSLFSDASGSVRGLGIDSSLLPSQVSSFPLSTSRGGSALEINYPPFTSLQDLEQATVGSLSKPSRQQHFFFGNELGSVDSVKHESQPLRPFFDEWPKPKDSWPDLEEERSNRTLFSTTQLSMSIPMASSDFSTTSSRSPDDD